MHTVYSTSAVYDMATGVHKDDMAYARAMYAATDVNQNLQWKNMLIMPPTYL